MAPRIPQDSTRRWNMPGGLSCLQDPEIQPPGAAMYPTSRSQQPQSLQENLQLDHMMPQAWSKVKVWLKGKDGGKNKQLWISHQEFSDSFCILYTVLILTGKWRTSDMQRLANDLSEASSDLEESEPPAAIGMEWHEACRPQCAFRIVPSPEHGTLIDFTGWSCIFFGYKVPLEQEASQRTRSKQMGHPSVRWIAGKRLAFPSRWKRLLNSWVSKLPKSMSCLASARVTRSGAVGIRRTRSTSLLKRSDPSGQPFSCELPHRKFTG